MGSTDYYQANIPAAQLASIAMTAGELDDWKEWSIFERFQRELATHRVDREIVPYLARTRDRFFGAIIVLVYDPEVFEFEDLPTMGMQVPAAYRDGADQMGFLNIAGGKLVVLDGQHRLAALRGVVTAGNELQGPYVDQVASDQLCVMFIRHESFEKTRRIFNKVNRYAKPTSPGENIVTSEDDGYAIVTRWLCEPQPPLGLSEPLPPFANALDHRGEPLIEWQSSNLSGSRSSSKITTLASLYETVKTALRIHRIHNFDERHLVNRPSDDRLADAYLFAAGWWHAVIDEVPVFRRSISSPWRIAEYREFRGSHSLLLRPLGLQAFFVGLEEASRTGLTREEIARRAGRLDWSAADPMWQDTVIYANGHMNSKGVALAGRLAGYRIAGERYSDDKRAQLQHDLSDSKGLLAIGRRYRLPRVA